MPKNKIENQKKPIEVAQKVIANNQQEAKKKSLLDRIITWIKDFIDFIFPCFKKNVEKADKINVPIHNQVQVVNEPMQPVQKEVAEDFLDQKEQIEWYQEKAYGMVLPKHVPEVVRSTIKDFYTLRNHEELVDIPKLKEKIRNIPHEYIYFLDVHVGRYATLLLLAIDEIQNRDLRVEIVQLLLEKGFKPTIKGKVSRPVNLRQLAEQTGDQLLIQFLEQKWKELDKEYRMKPHAEILKKEALKKSPEYIEKLKISQQAYIDAYDLLYHTKNAEPLSLEEQQHRFEKLKKIISKILEDHINDGRKYQDSGKIYSVGLLYLVLKNFKDNGIRFEIVKMLIENGADHVHPFYEKGDGFTVYSLLCPIEEAKKTMDKRLIDLLEGR